MAALVRVKVVVYENGYEVGETHITYFDGQPYKVQIDTTDGTDAEVMFTAGDGQVTA